MVHHENGSLGWIPSGPRLATTLKRARKIVSEQGHKEFTLEHVIFALTDDTDAARVLEANGVNVPRFRDYVARYIAAVDDRWPTGTTGTAEPDKTLSRIFDVASAAAESSGRREIDGALIVAAIIGEGKSNAADMLRQHGLNVEEDDRRDAPPAAVEPQTYGAVRGAPVSLPNDLTAIHQMLSERNGLAAHGSSGNDVSSAANGQQPMAVNRTPAGTGNALPALQRTRRKIVPQKTTAPLVNGQPSENPNTVGRTQSRPASGQHGTTGAASQIARTVGGPVPHVPPPPTQYPPVPQSPAAPQSGQATTVRPTVPNVAAAEETSKTAPMPVGGFTETDVNILHDILPRKMQVGKPEIIDIRVMNSDIEALTGQPEGRDVVHSGGTLVSRSLCLRLRSPGGIVVTEARSPEVQWINVDAGLNEDGVTSWRWQVTGQQCGDAQLQLTVCARTVDREGVVLETEIPEQVARIRIVRGAKTVFWRIVALLGLFLTGCAVGYFFQPILRLIDVFIVQGVFT